jgi:hypothetical protein
MTKEELEKAKIIGNHEATKQTLKRLGIMRDELVKIFLEQCRHCMHQYSRPDSPAFYCDQKDPNRPDGKYGCVYSQCPYVNREAI